MVKRAGSTLGEASWSTSVPSKSVLSSFIMKRRTIETCVSKATGNHPAHMKSAYELAMERLQKQAPTTKLTEKQKTQISELESLTKAKKAEQELFLNGEIAKAQAKGDVEALVQHQRQLKHELSRLDEELEKKKEKVRQG